MSNVKKWETVLLRSQYNEAKKLVYELEANAILDLLNPMKAGKLIDVGCGFGDVSFQLKRKSNFCITGIDIVDFALEKARSTISEDTSLKNIYFEKADVFHLPYADNLFDVAISTGYASAASYPSALNEVSRVVKKNGWIIIDYIRPYNVYNLLDGSFLKTIQSYRSGKNYSCGYFGLKKYIDQYFGLQITKYLRLYTYPPLIRNRTFNLIFEKTFGKILSFILARILLVKIKNNKI